MAHSYSFAIVRLAPEDGRDERINVGVAVFDEDRVDIRLSRRLEKARALSAAIDTPTLQALIESAASIDEQNRQRGATDLEGRHQSLARLGPLSLSGLGAFTANGPGAYEERLDAIIRNFVDPEPALRKPREKRSKLLTQVKHTFRREHVLASRNEDLDSHRILASYELDEGLVADLVLRNGAMHIVETVDASGETESVRRAVAEIGVAALVLERARMKFGNRSTKAQLVYVASGQLEKVAMPSLKAAEHQGAELINWASAMERGKFVRALISLATPLEGKRRRAARFAPPSGGLGF